MSLKDAATISVGCWYTRITFLVIWVDFLDFLTWILLVLSDWMTSVIWIRLESIYCLKNRTSLSAGITRVWSVLCGWTFVECVEGIKQPQLTPRKYFAISNTIHDYLGSSAKGQRIWGLTGVYSYLSVLYYAIFYVQCLWWKTIKIVFFNNFFGDRE